MKHRKEGRAKWFGLRPVHIFHRVPFSTIDHYNDVVLRIATESKYGKAL